MKQKSNLLTTLTTSGLLVLITMISRADDESTNPLPNVRPVASFQPFTLGIEAGTTGGGGHVSWRFASHFGVGTAFDYFSYSYHGTIQAINWGGHLRLMSEPLTLDLYPWKNRSFHISAGVLLNQNRLNGSASGMITLNGTDYPGTANLEIKQQVLDPYVGIGGNLYFDKAHHWSLGGELGVIYTGDPRVNFSATTTAPDANFDSNVRAERDQIQHYARDAQYWPVIKVSLNYSF